MTNLFSYFRFKQTVPFLVCLILIFLSQTPDSRFLFVPLAYIPIFYFAVFRPGVLNAYLLFLLGLLADTLTQTPFGLFSLLFVLMFFIARLNHLFLQELSFRNLWIFFVVLSGLLLLVQYFIFVLSESAIVHTKFLFQQFTVLSLFFPLGLRACDRLNHWMGYSE